MQIEDSEVRLLTKEEERLFGDGLRRALIHDRPNPERAGCPDPRVIRDFAFRRRRGDTETFERIADHMFECSPCAQDALVYAEEYKHALKKRSARLATIGLAATALLSLAVWQFARVQHGYPTAAKSPAPAYSAPPSTAAEARTDKNNERGVPNVTPIVIELPLSWRGARKGADRPIIIPRGHLQLEIRLPIGSPEGTYKLRISDKAGKAQKSAAGTARPVDGITSLRVTLDTSDLSPGNYSINLLEPGADAWADYPVVVK